ncbi:hypothetical protein KSF73_02910 [Burkholderiaceae bacterium DAT-1]|nr:hypothetical protein [Burkholderiaceae bacterium DAT-1]
MATQLHLVCVPDDLSGESNLVRWHAICGQVLTSDDPLVDIMTPEGLQTIHAPIAGVLTEQCYRPGDSLLASDLLAMLEGESDVPTFSLVDGQIMAVEDSPFSVPACRLGEPGEDACTTRPEVVILLSRLGLSASEVQQAMAVQALTEECVFAYVRESLRTLEMIRRLV